MDMQGTVKKLTRYANKGQPGEALRSIRLIEDLGMEGDFYAKGGSRQISLLSEEDRQWMAAQSEPGLCFARYRENILFEYLPPALLVPGIRLKIGEALLEISAEAKHCFEQCSLSGSGRRCALAGRSIFACVIQGGTVSIGDTIERAY